MAFSDKTFTIYSSTGDSRKTLKHPTQIALTVTPRNQRDLFMNQTPVVWKVLEFHARSDTTHTVTWNSDPGFAVVGSGQAIHVSMGNSGVLKSRGGGVLWAPASGRRNQVMARNETNIPQRFVLGSIDEEDVFSEFLRFPPTPSGSAISTEPAVMLQAYIVTGYKEGQLLSQVDSDSFIFQRYDGTSAPVDLTTLENRKSFCLSSEPSGNLILE